MRARGPRERMAYGQGAGGINERDSSITSLNESRNLSESHFKACWVCLLLKLWFKLLLVSCKRLLYFLKLSVVFTVSCKLIEYSYIDPILW